jgi:hypothetical protein
VKFPRSAASMNAFSLIETKAAHYHNVRLSFPSKQLSLRSPGLTRYWPAKEGSSSNRRLA